MPETQDAERSPPDPDVLDRILESKRREVEELRPRGRELRARAGDAPPPRDFRGALADPSTVALIAEVKRRSPGAGAIRPDLDPVALARSYQAAGASALSVLTDGEFFAGSLEDLTKIRAQVELPLLRKDFLLEEVQLWEARAAGADAVLLIVRVLDDARLLELRLQAQELGMAALVEAHDRREVERALAAGARIVGVNNRDLASFTTRLETTLELVDLIPDEVLLVSESGIRSGEDVERLGREGVDAVLVGESLLRAPEPGAAARRMALRPRSGRSAGAGTDS